MVTRADALYYSRSTPYVAGGSHHRPDTPRPRSDPSNWTLQVISGEVDLELDDGETVHLRAGDCVIQNGTRHAWRNRSDEPVVIFVTLLGARRQAG